MRRFVAFFKKEAFAHWRSGRLFLLTLLFVLFGVMNPAFAMLTPHLLEMFEESMATSGITIGTVTVSAMDSWLQFFKNIPMALLAFVLLESTLFTQEYQSGTLILALTKGLTRPQVLLSKGLLLALLWSAGYWLCAAITYAYNAYYWDNAVAINLSTALVNWWLFGLWMADLMLLFSTTSRTNIGVLGGCASAVLLCTLLGFFPKCTDLMPTVLTGGSAIISGGALPQSPVYLLTTAFILLALALSVSLFNKIAL